MKLRRILMTLTLTLSLVLFAQNVQAACSYYTYSYNGQMVHCTTCCWGNQCSTNCY
jgi:hypothetical protein